MVRVTSALLLVVAIGCKMQDEPAAGGGAPAAAMRDGGVAGAPAVPTLGTLVADGGAMPAASLDAVLGQALGVAEQLGKVAAANAHDCGALATALEALIVEHQPLLDALKRFQTDASTAKQLQTWMASHGPQIDAAMAAARPALEACRHDPRIKAAFMRLAAR